LSEGCAAYCLLYPNDESCVDEPEPVPVPSPEDCTTNPMKKGCPEYCEKNPDDKECKPAPSPEDCTSQSNEEGMS